MVEMWREQGFHSLFVASLRLLKYQGKRWPRDAVQGMEDLVCRYLSSRKRVFEHISKIFRASLAERITSTVRAPLKPRHSYRALPQPFCDGALTIFSPSPPKWNNRQCWIPLRFLRRRAWCCGPSRTLQSVPPSSIAS